MRTHSGVCAEEAVLVEIEGVGESAPGVVSGKKEVVEALLRGDHRVQVVERFEQGLSYR